MRAAPIAGTAALGGAATVARPLVSLATLPPLLHQLGTEGLGLWMIVLSTMGMIGFLNGGLAGAVVTAIGRGTGSSGACTLDRLATSATYLAVVCGLGTVIAGLPLALLINWHSLLGLSGAIASPDVTLVMVALVLVLGVGFPAVVPKYVMLGRQHGYVAHLIDFIGVLTSATLLLIAIWFHQPIYILVIGFLLTQYVVVFIGGALYLWREKISYLAWANFDRAIFQDLSRDGSQLALYQASFSVSSQSDLILIGMIWGAAASAGYGIAQRLFSLPMMLAASLNYALWPAFAKADAEGRYDWVKRVYLKTLSSLLAATTLFVLTLAYSYQSIVTAWLGHAIKADPGLIVGMMCWVVVTVAVHTTEMVLRARGLAALLTKCMVAMMFINLPISIFLVNRIGPAGAIWGTVIGYIACLLLPYFLAIRTMFSAESPAPIASEVRLAIVEHSA